MCETWTCTSSSSCAACCQSRKPRQPLLDEPSISTKISETMRQSRKRRRLRRRWQAVSWTQEYHGESGLPAGLLSNWALCFCFCFSFSSGTAKASAGSKRGKPSRPAPPPPPRKQGANDAKQITELPPTAPQRTYSIGRRPGGTGRGTGSSAPPGINQKHISFLVLFRLLKNFILSELLPPTTKTRSQEHGGAGRKTPASCPGP